MENFNRHTQRIWDERTECAKESRARGGSENDVSAAIKPYDEELARLMRNYNEQQDKRSGVINACSGRPNWNSCSYADFGYCDVTENGLALCWKQDGAHKCTHCSEIAGKA